MGRTSPHHTARRASLAAPPPSYPGCGAARRGELTQRHVVRPGALVLISAMSSLRAVVEQLTPEADGFAIDAPEDWGQGRTLYGGMTAALAYEAVKRAHGELAPLRSAQFSFIGPATGRLRFTSTLLRRGRSSTIIAADGF